MSEKHKDGYGLSKRAKARSVKAPVLPYQPPTPKTYNPNIGLIACGGITEQHLKAYRKAGYKVVALCDVFKERAEKRRSEFYPDASVTTDYHSILARDDIEVVDIAAHPDERVVLIQDALEAGKHVLTQKPFVLDLDVGRHLTDLADEKGLKLAVNQNGRWAPHFRYITEAIRNGLIGDVAGVHLSVHWNHGWIEGSVFEEIKHLILYDFGIHWFDALCCFMGGQKAMRVFASFTCSKAQTVKPALLAQALVEYEGAQATLTFDGDTRFGPQDRTYVIGSKGTIESIGPDLNEQTITLTTAKGYCSPKLDGGWFPDGFHGTMAELLCAIEEDREPFNSARNNLKSLALCFAAAASAESHKAIVPGAICQMPGE